MFPTRKTIPQPSTSITGMPNNITQSTQRVGGYPSPQVIQGYSSNNQQIYGRTLSTPQGAPTYGQLGNQVNTSRSGGSYLPINGRIQTPYPVYSSNISNYQQTPQQLGQKNPGCGCSGMK